jgi:hypothetical protein
MIKKYPGSNISETYKVLKQRIFLVLFKTMFLFLMCSITQMVLAQNTTAFLLKEPAGWEFERFNLPPVFAPDFPYQGVEELRFSPGMFKKDTPDYFTYAFVAQLDNTISISKDAVENYLLNYYKALCSATAKDRKLMIDTSKINIHLTKNEHTAENEIIYNAEANVLGVFADGAPVKLNMEIKVLYNAAAKKTYLLFIASPQEKTAALWKELYQVQKNFTVPN